MAGAVGPVVTEVANKEIAEQGVKQGAEKGVQPAVQGSPGAAGPDAPVPKPKAGKGVVEDAEAASDEKENKSAKQPEPEKDKKKKSEAGNQSASDKGANVYEEIKEMADKAGRNLGGLVGVTQLNDAVENAVDKLVSAPGKFIRGKVDEAFDKLGEKFSNALKTGKDSDNKPESKVENAGLNQAAASRQDTLAPEPKASAANLPGVRR